MGALVGVRVIAAVVGLSVVGLAVGDFVQNELPFIQIIELLWMFFPVDVVCVPVPWHVRSK